MRFKGVAFILLIFSVIFLFSCKPREISNDGISKNYITTGKKQIAAVHAEKFVTIAGNKINLPKESGNSLYKGIFKVGKDGVGNYSKVLRGGLLYFTTHEDVGFGDRAYLHVYDTLNKVFINDSEFKRKYLYSSLGEFYIDKDFVFCMSKPSWNEKLHSLRSSVAVYEVLDKRFHFLKVFSEPEEKVFTTYDIEVYEKRINKAQ